MLCLEYSKSLCFIIPFPYLSASVLCLHVHVHVRACTRARTHTHLANELSALKVYERQMETMGTTLFLITCNYDFIIFKLSTYNELFSFIWFII